MDDTRWLIHSSRFFSHVLHVKTFSSSQLLDFSFAFEKKENPIYILTFATNNKASYFYSTFTKMHTYLKKKCE